MEQTPWSGYSGLTAFRKGLGEPDMRVFLSIVAMTILLAPMAASAHGNDGKGECHRHKGEAVCLLEDGRPDFHALRSRHACRDARLIAYDLLALDGEDLRKMPLHERRRRLADLLADNDVIRFSGHVEGAKGAALFRRACAMGLEGIVSKRINAPYRSGPFLGWRKIKCPGYARP
jgi:ATP-dependent DNA ligase